MRPLPILFLKSHWGPVDLPVGTGSSAGNHK